jgi:hypothetical protein
MKEVVRHIRQYFYEVDQRIFFIVTPLLAVLIWANYHFGLDRWIYHLDNFWLEWPCRAALFFAAFSAPYFGYRLLDRRNYFQLPGFRSLLLIAPLIFSFKMAYNPEFNVSTDAAKDNFWNHVLYWPVLALLTTAILSIVRRRYDPDQVLYGFKTKKMDWTPYLTMLLIMLPLIVIAATQPDFQAMYPKLKLIADVDSFNRLAWWQKLLFEISYGTDFFTVELFFRGFLVLAFVKWAGKDAILPMACFYCTIHFGKPLGECISSYFGGMILGIVVYHTRSIFGGLMVHLGIAWMMEMAGYAAHVLNQSP